MGRTEPPNAIVSAFDEAADDWDAAHGPGSIRAHEFAARIAYLRALCRRFGRPKLLELGCGTGQNLIHLADLLTLGVGIDIAPAMVARARANARGLPLRFEVADAMRPDTAGPPFDIVLFCGTLEHLPDPSAAIGQAARVLAADGGLIVIMPHPWNPLVRLHRLLGARGAPPARHLSPRGLGVLAAPHGLGLAALHGLPYSPWPGLRPASIIARHRAPRTEPVGRTEHAPRGRFAGFRRGAYAAELRRRSTESP